MTPSSFIYHHPRTGDIFVIHLEDGRFAMAMCHIDRIGSDPIVYDDLDEVPDGPRHEIEQQIAERLK